MLPQSKVEECNPSVVYIACIAEDEKYLLEVETSLGDIGATYDCGNINFTAAERMREDLTNFLTERNVRVVLSYEEWEIE